MQVLRRLERLVEAEQSASDDPDLVFLTSLLQLAAGCRAMLRSRRFSFPAADPELLHSFYPLIMNFMLEVQIQDPNESDGRLPSLNASCVHKCRLDVSGFAAGKEIKIGDRPDTHRPS